ncbi:7166_t:CDS:2 [Paraglomus brasilianum]|uniref:7166_t:CDS:1 n=1 Tax=Paraglomus brasilianum TaxID=144538 RepID=A0A9N9G0W7_9GLOM|nr:7166_t:CDS:2 [Paraglomus brasilianum]
MKFQSILIFLVFLIASLAAGTYAETPTSTATALPKLPKPPEFFILVLKSVDNSTQVTKAASNACIDFSRFSIKKASADKNVVYKLYNGANCTNLIYTGTSDTYFAPALPAGSIKLSCPDPVVGSSLKLYY